MTIHKVFRPERKGDLVGCSYLNPDGHVVATFERRELGHTLRYVKIAQSIGLDSIQFRTGRIVFHSAAPLIAAASLPRVSVSAFIDNASPVAKAKGVTVSTVYFTSAVGSMSFHDLSILGGDVTIQTRDDESTETFEAVQGLDTWSTYPILRVYMKEGES